MKKVHSVLTSSILYLSLVSAAQAAPIPIAIQEQQKRIQCYTAMVNNCIWLGELYEQIGWYPYGDGTKMSFVFQCRDMVKVQCQIRLEDMVVIRGSSNTE